MQALTIVLGFLAILDLIFTPIVLSNIRKTGGFHYLISTLHKFVLFVLVSTVAFLFFRSGNANFLATNLVLVGTLAFLFVKTFEIDDYFLNQFEPNKYDTSNMTEEGKGMMQNVFEEMRSQNEKGFVERFANMVQNFLTNISQDIDVVIMTVTNNVKVKDAYTELHKMLGNDTKFSSMTVKNLFFLVKTRVVMDVAVVLAAAFVLIV